MPVDHPKVEYLFDRSGGRGHTEFDLWPVPPHDGRRRGFAGGTGADNITEAMAFVKEHYVAPVWLDMESRVRKDGWLDLEACKYVANRSVIFARTEP